MRFLGLKVVESMGSFLFQSLLELIQVFDKLGEVVALGGDDGPVLVLVLQEVTQILA